MKHKLKAKSKYKFKTILFFIIVILLLLSIGLFNYTIDPYMIFGGPIIPGINTIKPCIKTNTRLNKAYAIKNNTHSAIILGNSRVQYGIYPEKKRQGVPNFYNLGLPGATIYECLRYFQHASHEQKLEKVMLMLDFNACFTNSKVSSDFDEDSLSVDINGGINRNIVKRALSLWSSNTLNASFVTLFNQVGPPLSKNGFLTYPKRNIGIREAFLHNEIGLIPGYVNNLPLNKKDVTLTSFLDFKSFESIIEHAYQKRIDLRIGISPSHAREFQIIKEIGIWELFELWKKKLVYINESLAEEKGLKPFPIFDFSGYNQFTTEKILDNNRDRMKWYHESSHYTKELGNKILSKMWGLDENDQYNFGFLLTHKNIDTTLSKIRLQQEKYENLNPSEVKEIKKLVSWIVKDADLYFDANAKDDKKTLNDLYASLNKKIEKYIAHEVTQIK